MFAVLTRKLYVRMQVLQMLPQLQKLDNDDVAQDPSAEAGARPAPVEANFTAGQAQQPSSVTASAQLIASLNKLSARCMEQQLCDQSS